MEGKGAQSFTLLAASAAGLALYVTVFHRHVHWPLVAVAAIAIAVLALVGLGHLLMKRRPTWAVGLIELVPIASFAVATLVTFAAARAGVIVRQHLKDLPQAENDTLAEATGALIAGVAGLVVLTALADRASWCWPRRHVAAAFERRFTRRWKSGTPAADAIWEQNVLGAAPPIRGWGLRARRRRAAVIGAALAGNGTPPFVPVTGPPGTPPGAAPSPAPPPVP